MRLTRPYIASAVISIVFIACHPKPAPAAPPPNPDPGKFHEAPANTPPMQLVYDTTGPEKQALIAQLDRYYAGQVRAGFNGSVLIGVKGKIIYERYFGYSNRERKIPLNQNSADQLASVSKTFTGAAILYLYEHKYFDINDPVQKYIKEFPYPNITIKMLLDHRSGLADYTKWVPAHTEDTRTPITNQTMMDMMVKYKPRPEFKPNARFKYCNTNYAVLALLIERITDMPYSDFMTKYIFQPLGMTHTFVYSPSRGLPPDAAISYRHNWVREPDMFADGVCGDKGIYSTAQDMFRWDQSFYQNRLLTPDVLNMAYLPCSFEKPGIKNYGLGWRMLCYTNGNKIIYHNGWWHGNNTSFYRFVQEDMTIIVLGNRFTNAIYHQAPVVYSIIKGTPVEKGFDMED